nr:metallophosphoesterase [uncultured Friedmanniella sp.]
MPHPALPDRRAGWLTSTLGRRPLALALLSAVLLLQLCVTPAHAATLRVTTASCMDGGGITWHTKVKWGGTYTSGGTKKVSVDYAGWTSTLGLIATDSSVKSYDGSGRLVSTLTKVATVDYQQGTVYDGRNPVNPASGGAKVVIRVGRDRDGFASCSVTHREGAADPVIAAVGDMVCPPGYTATPSTCQHMAVSDSILAAKPSDFLALGDTQYGEGTPEQYAQAYQPSFGRLKKITRPVAGNHEYRTPGAGGYFGYFGTAAGDRARGYYSFDVGSWHVVALNSEVDISSTGAQLAWLKNDLAVNSSPCTLAMLHKPRFSSGGHGDYTSMKPFFDELVAARAELLLSGHDHNYERFSPMTGSGARSDSTGVTQLVVGTGGKSLNGTVTATYNSVVRSQAGHGWLKLTLRPTSADLSYVGVGDNPFTDRKTIACR